MLAKFNAAGVRAIFAGHYHRNAGGHFEDLELIVTSALGAQFAIDDPRDRPVNSGYRIVDVEANCIRHRYLEIEDVELKRMPINEEKEEKEGRNKKLSQAYIKSFKYHLFLYTVVVIGFLFSFYI